MSSKATRINEDVVRQYIGTLPDDEKSRFSFTTVEDILANARALEKQQAIFSRTRRISSRMEPVVKFLQRYARAVDIMVQFDVNPSALAWGCLRFLLEVYIADFCIDIMLICWRGRWIFYKLFHKAPFYDRENR